LEDKSDACGSHQNLAAKTQIKTGPGEENLPTAQDWDNETGEAAKIV
jgi:hypothetical protein